MATEFDLDDLPPTDVTEAMAHVLELEKEKEKGSELLKQGDFEGAMTMYDGCLKTANEKQKTFTSDYDAERKAEKIVLACYSNRALCALKMKNWAKAKECCSQGLEANGKVIQPDLPGKAKLLYRRGQACVGLNDARAAVDAMTEAIEIEERLLGASNRDATLKTVDEKAQKTRIATIQAMKREMVKAKKLAKAEEQRTQKENFGKAKGFLSATSKTTLTDSKTHRKEFLDSTMDRILSLIFANKEDKKDDDAIMNIFMKLLDQVQQRNFWKAKDLESRVRGAAVAGYLNFLLAEYEPKGSQSTYYQEAAKSWFIAFDERKKGCSGQPSDEESKEEPALFEDEDAALAFLEKELDDDATFFAPLGKVSALESAGHAFVRAGQPELARPYLIAYCEVANKTGELPAYHNLPDSYLLQRGMQKMDDKGRRAFRWKHRAHLKRAIFDAYSSVAAASKELGDRDTAIQAGLDAVTVAVEPDAKAVGHNNLAFLHGFKWKTYTNTPLDDDKMIVHSSLSKTFEKIHEREKEKEQDKVNKTKEIESKDDDIVDETEEDETTTPDDPQPPPVVTMTPVDAPQEVMDTAAD